MSHNTVKSMGHGFCDAIFSSIPINFDKENTNSLNKTRKTCTEMFNTPRKGIRNEDEDKCLKHEKRKMLFDSVLVENSKLTDIPFNSHLTHSKSINTLQRKQVLFPESILSNERYKTSTKVASATSLNDKTPTVHFCTPKLYKSRAISSATKMNVLPINKTPINRYLSDHVLSETTPNCFSVVQVETPCAKSNEIGIEDQTVYEGENSNLIVGIRVRPLNMKELSDSKIMSVLQVNGQSISVNCESIQHTFMYDHCFMSYEDPTMSSHASQETVFKNMVLPLVQNAFEGYNVCLFAYGQTGSGKSYSMMGQESSQTKLTMFDEASGIIPRFCQEIFTRIPTSMNTKTTVEISYFEIYNEKIHDLLTNVNNGVKRAPLKVREHPVFGPYIVDLSQHCVQNYKDLQTWLRVGNSQRATAATGMNEKSSRSHSIFSIILTQTQVNSQLDKEPVDPSRRSKINLVDLAGSERLSQTCASGDRLKEGVSINKSLLTLGKVIASLAESTNNRKRGFVPYRESVLTWLLKESLGGNSRTAMLGTVSPANIHVEETLSTLRYACQARAIINRVRINEDPHEKLIRELKAEVQRLRGVREGYEKQLGIQPRRLLDSIEPPGKNHDEVKQKQQEIDKLKDQLKKTEEQLATTQMTWLKRLRETEERKNSELKYLRRCGIAIEIDIHEKDKQPCLINLAADPMLSGTLLYLIPPGLVRIGKNSGPESSSKILDIMLDGPLVRPLHCTIENSSGKLTLSSEMDGDTYVNGQIVTGKVVLKHGDRLVIGGNHYFKVSNPHDGQSNIQISAQAMDYEFAYQEILKVQEEKLRAELEESKQKAIKELENAKREVEMQLGSQKSSYERKIEVLGSTVEEQKLALEQIHQKKKELELERELLVNEVEIGNRLKQIQSEEKKVTVTPYKSNFLEELENILSEKTADAEFALKMKASTEAINGGGITLHEMQLLVREATERCREVGINYEFDQQQMILNKSLKPVIRIRNRDSMKETIWQPMRFLDWVHGLRDYDIEDSIKELCTTSNETWEPYENTETFEDSLNNSRISINMTPVKKHLNESLQQFSMDTSVFGTTFGNQTFNNHKEQDTVNSCLIQIEFAAKTLRKLCDNNGEIQSVAKSLDDIQNIIDNLRKTFEERGLCERINESLDYIQRCDGTVIENSGNINLTLSENPNKDCVKSFSSPTKSTLHNSNRVIDKTIQKNVRFSDKLRKEVT
ncbi:PREDICTED: kinesin-like protein KIF14 [Dufourea novaeangliae]|uniref:Kinesin-like protein KIF14 n=1 Tax=Dufourea novaeangliae TaxID=178035 RepID=A0A154PCQ1_DUFNO|nr:PREDICTED: kinesin-like protein KIF14 [Dufourea novaeangliae]KZC09567.1 Kinesin-like protein KIF14 [Dufourea novaeangliae]